MATKKVKKFGRGGDILTGLGAGLAAYGAYKHFFGDKDKEKSSTTTNDESAPKPADAGRRGENLIREAVESKNEAKGDTKSEDKEYSKQGKFPYEAGYGTSGARLGDKDGPAPASVANNAKKPRRVDAKKKDDDKKADNKKDRNAEFANLYQRLTTTPPAPAPADTRLKSTDVSGVGSNLLGNVASRRAAAAAREKAAKDRLARFEQQRKESKEREARRTQAQNRAKSGTSQRSPSLRAPGSKVDLNDPYSMTLGSDLDPKSLVRRNRSRLPGEDTEYKKGGKIRKFGEGGSTSKSIPRKMYENVMGTPEQNEQAQKRMDERDKKNPDSMPAKINRAVKSITGKKGGGAVKKYASGGSVSSASKRGDGIAMRGKTKGRIY